MKDYLSLSVLRPLIGIIALVGLAVLLANIQLDLRGAIVAVALVIIIMAVCFLPVHFKRSHPRHHKIFSGILYGIGFLIIVVALGYAAFFIAVQPSLPDSFYENPAEIPTAQGTLIRHDEIQADVKNAKVERILYSSQDKDGQPSVVSGMVFTPNRPPPSTGYPVIAWAHGTLGVTQKCAPSLAPQLVQKNIGGVQEYIDAGYMVVATDYQGLGTGTQHPYLIGKAAAQNVLDSVRTVVNDNRWNADNRFVVSGHSQGGHSALFTTQFAKTYASELDLRGTVAMSPPTKLSDLLAEDLPTPAGRVFGSMALVSWDRIFDNAGLHRVIHDEYIPLMETIAFSCIENTDQGLPILPEVELMGENFVKANPADTEPWQSIIALNSPQPDNIPVPLFIAQGSIDPVVDPKITAAWAQQLCTQNPSVFYKVYEGKSHLDVVAPAVKDTLPWIHDRFANTAAPSSC